MASVNTERLFPKWTLLLEKHFLSFLNMKELFISTKVTKTWNTAISRLVYNPEFGMRAQKRCFEEWFRLESICAAPCAKVLRSFQTQSQYCHVLAVADTTALLNLENGPAKVQFTDNLAKLEMIQKTNDSTIVFGTEQHLYIDDKQGNLLLLESKSFKPVCTLMLKKCVGEEQAKLWSTTPSAYHVSACYTISYKNLQGIFSLKLFVLLKGGAMVLFDLPENRHPEFSSVTYLRAVLEAGHQIKTAHFNNDCLVLSYACPNAGPGLATPAEPTLQEHLKVFRLVKQGNDFECVLLTSTVVSAFERLVCLSSKKFYLTRGHAAKAEIELWVVNKKPSEHQEYQLHSLKKIRGPFHSIGSRFIVKQCGSPQTHYDVEDLVAGDRFSFKTKNQLILEGNFLISFFQRMDKLHLNFFHLLSNQSQSTAITIPNMETVKIVRYHSETGKISLISEIILGQKFNQMCIVCAKQKG